MKKVLLLVDQKARDLLSILLIGEYLQELGIKAYYCNKRNMLSMALRYRPDIFVMSCSEDQYLNVARHIAPFCKIVLMTQEGACSNKQTTITRHTLDGMVESYLKGLSRVYLWGESSKKWLLEERIYPEEVMRVVGTSRLDIYRLPAAVLKNGHKTQKFKIGFASRGEMVNPVSGANPVMRLDASREKVGGHRAYNDSDRELEDWVWHCYASLRVNLNLIERLAACEDVEVIFRPDPFENVASYDFLKRKYKNFNLNTDPVLRNFINEIDVLVTEYSTTGVEALLLNKPVLSMQKLIGPRLADHSKKYSGFQLTNTLHYWHPETEDEFFEMLDRARKGELPYSPRPEDTQVFLKDMYNWDPRAPSAAYAIALDLKSLSESEKPPELLRLHAQEFREHPLVGKISAAFRLPAAVARTILLFPGMFDLFGVYRAFRSGNIKSHLRMQFYPWNFREKAAARNVFRRLKTELKPQASVPSSKPSLTVIGSKG